MKSLFSGAMHKAAKLTQNQNVIEATRVIRRALSGGRENSSWPTDTSSEKIQRIEPKQTPAEVAGFARAGAGISAEGAARDFGFNPGRVKRPLGEVLELLRTPALPGFGLPSKPVVKARRAPPVPDGAGFLTRTFACEAGSRDYKLYVPSRMKSSKRPLIVMLHGCAQNPDDFAAGTGMNLLAEEHGFIVAYPRQPTSSNPTACWNWFNIKDQMRDIGEPSILAGITRHIMAEFDIDSKKVFMAGLSAGGAMTSIMSTAYPELYAAAGIHSGLAYGSATDLPSAFAAMRGNSGPAEKTPKRRGSGKASGVRTIVFHGASDQTVHPANADQIVAAARAELSDPELEIEQGQAGGRKYTRTIITEASGVPHVEYWAIQGLGHAWSGGRPEGSYTDHQGPDATLEMLRFFLKRPTPTPR